MKPFPFRFARMAIALLRKRGGAPGIAILLAGLAPSACGGGPIRLRARPRRRDRAPMRTVAPCRLAASGRLVHQNGLSVAEGGNHVGLAGSTLPLPLSVHVTDGAGRPVSGVLGRTREPRRLVSADTRMPGRAGPTESGSDGRNDHSRRT